MPQRFRSLGIHSIVKVREGDEMTINFTLRRAMRELAPKVFATRSLRRDFLNRSRSC